MAITMYSASVPTFLQLLGGLKGVLQKVEAHATAHKWDTSVILNQRFYPDMFTHATAHKWDTSVILNQRFYPDMFTFERQVRQACVHAQGAGRVAGVALPSLPESDNDFAGMQARIDKVIDFNKGLSASAIDGKEDSEVTIIAGGNERKFKAQIYLFHFAMPNFYFHTTTAYNIARSLGVEIGKRDFMGQMPS